jgi:hypothetical protein
VFALDTHMPRINRGLVYLGACLIAGIRWHGSPTGIVLKTLQCQLPARPDRQILGHWATFQDRSHCVEHATDAML